MQFQHRLKVFLHCFFLQIENVRLQGMSLSVFAKILHLPFVRFVKTSYERTGFRGNWVSA